MTEKSQKYKGATRMKKHKFIHQMFAVGVIASLAGGMTSCSKKSSNKGVASNEKIKPKPPAPVPPTPPNNKIDKITAPEGAGQAFNFLFEKYNSCYNQSRNLLKGKNYQQEELEDVFFIKQSKFHDLLTKILSADLTIKSQKNQNYYDLLEKRLKAIQQDLISDEHKKSEIKELSFFKDFLSLVQKSMLTKILSDVKVDKNQSKKTISNSEKHKAKIISSLQKGFKELDSFFDPKKVKARETITDYDKKIGSSSNLWALVQDSLGVYTIIQAIQANKDQLGLILAHKGLKEAFDPIFDKAKNFQMSYNKIQYSLFLRENAPSRGEKSDLSRWPALWVLEDALTILSVLKKNPEIVTKKQFEEAKILNYSQEKKIVRPILTIDILAENEDKIDSSKLENGFKRYCDINLPSVGNFFSYSKSSELFKSLYSTEDLKKEAKEVVKNIQANKDKKISPSNAFSIAAEKSYSDLNAKISLMLDFSKRSVESEKSLAKDKPALNAWIKGLEEKFSLIGKFSSLVKEKVAKEEGIVSFSKEFIELQKKLKAIKYSSLKSAAKDNFIKKSVIDNLSLVDMTISVYVKDVLEFSKNLDESFKKIAALGLSKDQYKEECKKNPQVTKEGLDLASKYLYMTPSQDSVYEDINLVYEELSKRKSDALDLPIEFLYDSTNIFQERHKIKMNGFDLELTQQEYDNHLSLHFSKEVRAANLSYLCETQSEGLAKNHIDLFSKALASAQSNFKKVEFIGAQLVGLSTVLNHASFVGNMAKIDKEALKQAVEAYNENHRHGLENLKFIATKAIHAMTSGFLQMKADLSTFSSSLTKAFKSSESKANSNKTSATTQPAAATKPTPTTQPAAATKQTPTTQPAPNNQASVTAKTQPTPTAQPAPATQPAASKSLAKPTPKNDPKQTVRKSQAVAKDYSFQGYSSNQELFAAVRTHEQVVQSFQNKLEETLSSSRETVRKVVVEQNLFDEITKFREFHKHLEQLLSPIDQGEASREAKESLETSSELLEKIDSAVKNFRIIFDNQLSSNKGCFTKFKFKDGKVFLGAKQIDTVDTRSGRLLLDQHENIEPKIGGFLNWSVNDSKQINQLSKDITDFCSKYK